MRSFSPYRTGDSTVDRNLDQLKAVIDPIVSSVQSSGSYSGSLTAVVAIYNSPAGQTFPTAVGTVVNFENKVVDTCNAVTTGSNWHFTVPVAGYYQLDGNLTLAAGFTGTADVLFLMWKNDVQIGRGTRWSTSGSVPYVAPLCHVLSSCSVGDTLYCSLYQNSGASRITEANPTSNQIEIIRVPYL